MTAVLPTAFVDDEDAARALFERCRWPNGPVCPHCGSHGAYRLRPKPQSARPVRKGVLKCRACRKQFTVTVGTIFERSHIPLSAWLLAIRDAAAFEDASSAARLRKLLKLSHRGASLMAERFRHALSDWNGPRPTPGRDRTRQSVIAQ